MPERQTKSRSFILSQMPSATLFLLKVPLNNLLLEFFHRDHQNGRNVGPEWRTLTHNFLHDLLSVLTEFFYHFIEHFC